MTAQAFFWLIVLWQVIELGREHLRGFITRRDDLKREGKSEALVQTMLGALNDMTAYQRERDRKQDARDAARELERQRFTDDMLEKLAAEPPSRPEPLRFVELIVPPHAITPFTQQAKRNLFAGTIGVLVHDSPDLQGLLLHSLAIGQRGTCALGVAFDDPHLLDKVKEKLDEFFNLHAGVPLGSRPLLPAGMMFTLSIESQRSTPAKVTAALLDRIEDALAQTGHFAVV